MDENTILLHSEVYKNNSSPNRIIYENYDV
jgi:hypothetical protein